MGYGVFAQRLQQSFVRSLQAMHSVNENKCSGKPVKGQP